MTDLMTRKKAHTMHQYEKFWSDVKDILGGCALGAICFIWLMTLLGFRVL